MELLLIGMNHKSAPVAVREQLSCGDDQVTQILSALKESGAVSEAYMLSTCNRLEILTATSDVVSAEIEILNVLAAVKQVPAESFKENLYILKNEDAVAHLFRVGASLDSMVVGEPQILGQVKSAYHYAVSLKTSGVVLNRLLHRTFQTAKRVRTETGIGGSAVSISYAAIELARKIFGELDGKKVLLVGAGEMAELAVEHVIRHRATDITVANRTFKRGVDLARRFNGTAIRFEEIPEALRHVDIIISSTGATDVVIRRDQVKPAMKKRHQRPIFFIDIAVPRDIDPDINKISNAYVYDIDDLKGVIDENKEERLKEAMKGERIVDDSVIRFMEWFHSLRVVPTIVDLRAKVEGIVSLEIQKSMALFPDITTDQTEALGRMTEAVVSKLVHDPIRFLKNPGHRGLESEYVALARKFFDLDAELPAENGNGS